MKPSDGSDDTSNGNNPLIKMLTSPSGRLSGNDYRKVKYI
jgi:hypothetical protein